ncbi:hypothetical protein [Pseudomonas caricapapayae]|uniref:hypothetical protein n=1 Tax=Pseudomonas caricapapayae TaxID=46678 RepID=UPI000EFFDF0F|nr:hypothetical protein [Pseudomonas caricapapayae]
MKLYTERQQYEKAVQDKESSPHLFEHGGEPTDELIQKGMESLLRKIRKETTSFHLSILGKLTNETMSKYLFCYYSNFTDEDGYTIFEIYEFYINPVTGKSIACNGRLFDIFNDTEIELFEIQDTLCDFYDMYRMYATFKYNQDHTFLEFLKSPTFQESWQYLNLIEY